MSSERSAVSDVTDVRSRRQSRLSREEKKALTRDKLLEAAARVFARRGYNAASVEDVAEEAGFSKGAVYSNFATKEDLFLTLFDQRTRQKLDLIGDVFRKADSLEGRAHEGGERLAAIIERNRDWCLLFMEFWASAARDPALRRKFAAHYEAMRTRVAIAVELQAQELGIALAMPALDLAAGLIALGEGLMLQKLADPGRFPEGLSSSMLEMFFTGAFTSGERDESGGNDSEG